MIKHTTYAMAGALALVLAWGPAKADQLQNIINTEQAANRTLVQAQEQIDTVSDQTDDLVAEYRQVIVENEQLRTYNNQVRALVQQQQADLTLLDEQIGNITLVKRQIMPLIQDMLDSLRLFVEQDLPFRQEQRLQRIASLQALMTQPDVAESERYRLVLERYEIEAEYGQTIEAWPGEIELGGNLMPVNFLRIGRVSLMAQTQGSNITSYWWDMETGGWVELASSYNSPISQAIQMAEGVTQINFVELPFPAPQEAE